MRDDRNGVVSLVPQKALYTRLPLVLGEFFYQLRAALDGAMWASYQKLGSSTGKLKEEALYFPLCKTSAGLKKATFNSIPLPNQLKSWIESIQPCNASNLPIGSEGERLARSLQLIDDIATKDRHRALQLIGTVISSNTALVEVSAPAAVTYIRNLEANPLEGQYEIAEFGVEGMTTATEVNVNGNFTLKISVEGMPDRWDFLTGPFQFKDDVLHAMRRFDESIK